MSDNMTDRADRLRASRKKGPNVGAVTAIALVSGLAVGGAGVWYMQGQGPEPTGPVLDASSSREFQQDSKVDLRPVLSPTPQLTQPDVGPSPEEIALQKRVTELEGMIAQLGDVTGNADPQATEVPQTVVDTAQLDAMQKQLDDLAAELNNRQAELITAVGERDALVRDAVRKDAELNGLTLRLEQAETNTLEGMAEAEEAAKRQQELARRRAEALAIAQAQINSPIDGLSGGSADSGEREYTGDEAFIRAGSDRISATKSRVIGSPSNTVMQGTVIEATLTTGINSALSGTISSTVSYDIWSFDMRQVLIPRGSQMFGRYSNEVALGQKRVLVAWDRLVTPDGQVVDLEAYGADRLGRSGLTGVVDTRFGARFGAAAAISVFSVLPALAAAQSEDETTSEIAEGLGTNAQNATSSIVEEYLALSPIITVEHGDVITVMVTNDLELF